MRIAIIHLGRKGAGPVYTLEMAKALQRMGHEVIYYASAYVENKKYVEKETFEKRFFETYTSRLSYAISVIFRFGIKKVIQSLLKDNPDVVYSTMNDLWQPFIFPSISRFTRVKTIHDVGIHEGNDSRFNKWWNATAFRDAEKFVVLSKKFVPQLQLRGISQNNITVIPHAGFDFYVRNNVDIVKRTRKQLLFFGRIDRYKGIKVLLDAMPIILQTYPDLLLTIAGNGDMSEYSGEIESIKQNVNVINRWIKDEEVAEIVEPADVVILPYTHATQSGVIPLAYAFSKPVIATNVGGLDEQVVEGITGYIVPSHNPKAIANAVIRIYAEEGKPHEMGQKAHQYMEENLTWESSAKRFTEFLSK